MRFLSKSTIHWALTLVIAILVLMPGSAVAALEYVGGASATGTAATYNVSLTSLSGGIGTAAQAGDLVIVVTGWASAADGDPGVSTAGYTEVYDLYGNDTRDANLSVNWKIMGGTPDTSVTVRGFNNAANGGATVVHVWRGADQTTPMDVTPPTGATAINAARPDSPAITPVTAGAYVLTVGLGTGAAAPTAMTAPAGYGNALSATGGGGTMGAVACIASIAWAGGPVDPGAWTGGGSTTSDSWAAGTLAIRPATDSLSVTGNVALATAAAPLATNVTMQRLQLECSAGGDGCVLTSVTVDDLGSAGATDITSLKITLDVDTTLGNGNDLGTVTQAGFNGSSTLISLAAIPSGARTVTSGTPKYLWITYDLATSAAGKSIQSSVTVVAVESPDTGASGSWNSNLINVSSGPANSITSCADCHDNPPVDGSARNVPEGAVVGNHAKHNYPCADCHGAGVAGYAFGHRDATISMSAAVNYTRGTSFPQSNNPTTGSCNSVTCHGGIQTPQWGVGNTDCSSCHSLPPASGAHARHYAAKGWATGSYALCVVCHIDNTGTHTDRTDNTVYVNPAFGPGGDSPAITCASTSVTGCHNGKTTPAWNTTGIACSACHAAGGAAAGDPNSGLHATTNLLDHDDAFGSGGTCTSCHSSTAPSSLHFDGTVQNAGAATYSWNTTYIPAGYNRVADACAATCHADSASWNRRWSGRVDQAWAYGNDAAAATVCGNCHGSFATGWNIIGETSHDNPDPDNDNNPATADNPDTLFTSRASHGECSKCHTWGHASYVSGSKHVNNAVEMNSTLGYANGSCSTNCHAGQTLTMSGNSGWPDATVAGDGVSCGDCHNGGVQPGAASGAHTAHGAGSAQLVAGGAACVPCHGNNGGLGFESTLAGSHGIGNTVNWASNLTYSAARGVLSGTCSGTAGCHVATTNIAWNATQTNCNTCHYSTTDTANWGWTGTAGNISMISSTEYTARGHGQTTINGVAANKGCMDCHDITAGHDKTATLTGSNPFRLKSGFSCNNDAAGCHTVSGLYTTHEQATAGKNYTWSFGAKCVDCHDPHGDGSNLAMIHTDLADKGSQANWVRNAPDAAIEPMVFTSTAGTAADSYAEPSPNFDGICQECHTQTASFRDNTSAATGTHAANTSNCMNCHNHKNEGFKGAGCNGCHGGDNATIANKNFWPGGSGSAYPKRAGEHNVHIQQLAAKLGYPFNDTLTDQQQLTMCAFCHTYTTAPGEGGHDDNVAPANVGAFNPLWSAMTGNYPSTTDDGSYTPGNGTNGTCATVDCHNNQTTSPSYDWYDGATSSCVMCHTVGGTNTATTAHPASGIHDVARITGRLHDDNFAYGTNGASTATCTTCHSATPTTAGGHINGTNDYSIGVNDVTGARVNLVADVGFTDAVVPSCAPSQATGCHFEQWAAATDHTWTRLWHEDAGLNTGAECKGCHGTFTQGWRAGINPSHTNDYDGNNGEEIRYNHDHGAATETEYNQCISCHVYNDAGYGSLGWNPTAASRHGNGQIEMITGMGYNTTTNTCATTCHDGLGGNHAMTPDSGWAVVNLAGPALDCTICHSGIYNGAAGTHIDADGPGTAFIPGTTAGTTLCGACHTQHAQASDTTAANKIIISTRDGSNNPIPTMTDNAGNALYSSHGYKIWLGGAATSNALYTTTINATTEAQMCWGCHDKLTADHYTFSGVNVTFTAPATIAATGIGNKFAVGRWITIFGSSNAANNRTFRVASSSANSITVTIPTGAGNLVSVASAAGVTIVSPVSEWQVNQNSATGDLDYDYGMLFTDANTVPGTRTSDWTTGVWRSGKGLAGGATGRGAYNPFWYKRGTIQSTHTANIGGTFTAAVTAGNSLGYNRTETKDAVANIRCSYCHDVHGTHDGIKGDVAGKPYLRGTWKGNPYPEDGAPQWGMNNVWTVNSNFGRVPRASAANNVSGLTTVAQAGGFWIDQNSNNPNNGATATGTAGLCDQCHGSTKDGSWTAAELGVIDQTTGEALWVSGYNGHANVVVSASGAESGGTPTAGGAEIRARNIFSRSMRKTGTTSGAILTLGTVVKADTDMGLATETGRGYSYRSSTNNPNNAYQWRPHVLNTDATVDTTTGQPYAYQAFAWNKTASIATGSAILTFNATTPEPAHDAQVKYHNFNCAKCHNPHASRLPKLMITNCLDTNHNTWEDNSTFIQSPAGFTALPTPWNGTRHSQFASAQNCHRLDARAVLSTGQVTTLGKGWNKATPWLESTAPNTATATNPNP